jgi:O-antigen/teichoic acid export membrane protein
VSITKSIAATNLSFVGVTLMRLVSTALVARLITPDEMGVWTLGFAFIGIFQIVRDLGTTAFIQTSIELTDDDIRTCNGLQVLLGSLFFAIFWFAAPIISSFYGDARVVNSMRISAVSFLIIPFSSTIFSSFLRDGRFALKSSIDFVGQFCIYFGSVILAYKGLSYLAAPIAVLVAQTAIVIACWTYKRDGFPTGWSLVNWRRVTGQGGTALSISLVQHASDRGGDYILPKTQGFAQSSFYEKGVNVLELVKLAAVEMFGSVLISNLRQIAEKKPEYFATAAGRTLAIIVLVSVLGSALVAFNAQDVILTLFGTQWVSAIPSMKILALAIPLAAVSAVLVKIFYIQQQHALAFKLVFFSRILLVCLLFLASFYSLSIVASAVVIGETALALVTLHLARKFVALNEMGGVLFVDALLIIFLVWLASYAAQNLELSLPIFRAVLSGLLALAFVIPAFLLFRKRSIANLKSVLSFK